MRSLIVAFQERDETCVAVALSIKPRLGLYNRVTEGTRFMEYALRHTDGHQAAIIRLQFRPGISMLDYHLPSHHYDRHSRHLEDGSSVCPTCRTHDDDLVEDVPHALFCSVTHGALLRATFLDSLTELADAPFFASFMSLSPMRRSVALLRDDFMSSVANYTIVHRRVDKYLVDIVSRRVDIVG